MLTVIVLDPGNRSRTHATWRRQDHDFPIRLTHGKLFPAETPWCRSNPGRTTPSDFSPEARYVFVLNELHSTVTVFARDPEKGSLKRAANLNHSAAGFHGANTGADIPVSLMADFFTVRNRVTTALLLWINPRGGSARLGTNPPEATPQLCHHPAEHFCWWQIKKSDNIVVFRIDQEWPT